MSKRHRTTHELTAEDYKVLAGPVNASELALATREVRKRQIAKRVLPFFKQIAIQAKTTQVTYNRDKLELIVEAARDYLMQEAADDPDLDEDQKMAIAEVVTGIAKGWGFARQLIDQGALQMILPFYIVSLEHMAEIAEAIEIDVVDRGPLSPDLIRELTERPALPPGPPHDPPGAPP